MDEWFDLLDRSKADRIQRAMTGKSDMVERGEILLPDRQSAALAAAQRANNPNAVMTIPVEYIDDTLGFNPEWVVGPHRAPARCCSSPATRIGWCRRRNRSSYTLTPANPRSWSCSRA